MWNESQQSQVDYVTSIASLKPGNKLEIGKRRLRNDTIVLYFFNNTFLYFIFQFSGVSGQTITGLVIAKQNGRQIAGKNGDDRGALSFTIKDSSATVNVTCWGLFQFIQQLSQK